MSGIYMAYFSNRVLKVGMSTAPTIRVAEINKKMQKSGVTMTDFVIIDKIADARPAEQCLIDALVAMGKERTGKEWFVDVDFCDVRDSLCLAVEAEMQRQSKRVIKKSEKLAERLRIFAGRYKEIADATGVSHDLVRKYARGYMPKGSTLDAEKIAAWLRGASAMSDKLFSILLLLVLYVIAWLLLSAAIDIHRLRKRFSQTMTPKELAERLEAGEQWDVAKSPNAEKEAP